MFSKAIIKLIFFKFRFSLRRNLVSRNPCHHESPTKVSEHPTIEDEYTTTISPHERTQALKETDPVVHKRPTEVLELYQRPRASGRATEETRALRRRDSSVSGATRQIPRENDHPTIVTNVFGR